MNSNNGFPRLAEEEEHFLIPGPRVGMRLFLRRLGATAGRMGRAVLYVHGATFPSGLSIAHRFDGRSWRDALCGAGFDVWALDFYGFGHSDRYPEMAEPADGAPPLGLAADAAKQLSAAVMFLLAHDARSSLSLISHSWGSMPAGLFATEQAALVDRWVLFAPIARREPLRYEPIPSGPAWRMVSVKDQWDRFVEDVPPEEPPVLSRQHFDEWAKSYLESDRDSSQHQPAAVRTPSGPFVEILRAWHGKLAYEPAAVQAPIAIIRGAWDGLVPDGDARWLLDAFTHSTNKRDVKIGRATHLMHLEVMRGALWNASINFLKGDDVIEAAGKERGHEPDSDNAALPKKPPAPTNAPPPPNSPGYNPGSPEVAKSPISMDDWEKLKQSAFFSDEDVTYLRLSYDVLKDQAEDLVQVWRGIIMSHPHLRAYDEDPKTGEIDKAYAAAVGKRFAQWVIDTAKAEYDQKWLDYQYEIGLRHHRTKKNKTDGGHTIDHIRARDLIAFAAATVAPMKPHLAKKGHTASVVDRMYDAWWKSMILQVTLWSQPYMKAGDF
jgi:pimeloyl-ACP methyl ester carboxylesterase